MRENVNAALANVGSDDFKVGFLSLKNGERAIVRFLIDSDEDFDVIKLHSMETAEGKNVRVDCIRTAHDPVDMCPLCGANAKLETRVFLRMLQYVDDGTGNFIPKAKIWDRSIRSDTITALKTYLMDYGPLSNIICSISRTGEGLDTKYTISPNLPGGEKYVLDASDFEGYDVVGTVVRSWDAEQMIEFLNTGNIPAKKTQDAYTGATPAGQTFTNDPVNDSNVPWTTQQVAPAPQAVAPQPTPAPVPQPAQPATEAARPRRFYN